MTQPNPESLPQQESTPPAQPAQTDITPAQLIEALHSLPDRVVEAMKQTLAVAPPKQTSTDDQGAKTQQTNDNPGGKFFGYPSFGHWFAGDKGSQ